MAASTITDMVEKRKRFMQTVPFRSSGSYPDPHLTWLQRCFCPSTHLFSWLLHLILVDRCCPSNWHFDTVGRENKSCLVRFGFFTNKSCLVLFGFFIPVWPKVPGPTCKAMGTKCNETALNYENDHNDAKTMTPMMTMMTMRTTTTTTMNENRNENENEDENENASDSEDE